MEKRVFIWWICLPKNPYFKRKMYLTKDDNSVYYRTDEGLYHYKSPLNSLISLAKARKVPMKILKTLFVFAVVMFAGESLAQCPMQPQVMGGGPPRCWGDPTPSQQYNNQSYSSYANSVPQYGMYNGQQMLIPQGYGVGDSFVRNIGGQPMRCTIADRAVTAAVDAVIGAGVGALADRNNHRRGAIRGAAIGAVAGFTLLCNPNMVNDEPQMRYMQQGGISQASYGRQESFERREREPSHCVIEGKDWTGLTRENCRELAQRLSERSAGTTTYVARKEFPAEAFRDTREITRETSERDSRDSNISEDQVERFKTNCQKEGKLLVFVFEMKKYQCALESMRNNPGHEIIK